MSTAIIGRKTTNYINATDALYFVPKRIPLPIEAASFAVPQSFFEALVPQNIRDALGSNPTSKTIIRDGIKLAVKIASATGVCPIEKGSTGEFYSWIDVAAGTTNVACKLLTMQIAFYMDPVNGIETGVKVGNYVCESMQNIVMIAGREQQLVNEEQVGAWGMFGEAVIVNFLKAGACFWVGAAITSVWTENMVRAKMGGYFTTNTQTKFITIPFYFTTIKFHPFTFITQLVYNAPVTTILTTTSKVVFDGTGIVLKNTCNILDCEEIASRADELVQYLTGMDSRAIADASYYYALNALDTIYILYGSNNADMYWAREA